MDIAESITFTSKLTFWDKFKCFYLLHLYSFFSLYNAKKWQRILGRLLYIYILITTPILIFLDDDLGSKIFDIFCLLSFFWMPAITAFIVARKIPDKVQLVLIPENGSIPDKVQLVLIPENGSKTPGDPSLKVRFSDDKIERFKNAILFDTPNFYVIVVFSKSAGKKMRLIYNIISKKQNSDILAKFNFVKTISPDLKKVIKLHI